MSTSNKSFASNKAFNKVLIPARTQDGRSLSKKIIESETRKVVRKIEAEYGPYDGDKSKVPLVVGVQFGAIHIHPLFMESLSVGFPVYPGTIRAKSYRKNGVREPVEITDPVMSTNIEGRRVLIVDDIIESGATLFALKDWFLNRHASDVRIFTLLAKPDKKEFPIEVDWSVFELKPGQWVVGKGLDDDDLFRHFPNVVILEETQKADAGANGMTDTQRRGKPR